MEAARQLGSAGGAQPTAIAEAIVRSMSARRLETERPHVSMAFLDPVEGSAPHQLPIVVTNAVPGPVPLDGRLTTRDPAGSMVPVLSDVSPQIEAGPPVASKAGI